MAMRTSFQNWYKKAEEIYRGDPSPVNLEDYDPDYGRKQLGKERGSTGRGGPGIYFTTKEEDARSYGENVTRKILQGANILTDQSPKLNRRQVDKILQGIPMEKMELAASNWDENYNTGKNMIMANIMGVESPIEQLMLIWSDIFSHQDPLFFMELMAKNGIDGIAMPRIDSTHYAIYNRAILK